MPIINIPRKVHKGKPVKRKTQANTITSFFSPIAKHFKKEKKTDTNADIVKNNSRQPAGTVEEIFDDSPKQDETVKSDVPGVAPTHVPGCLPHPHARSELECNAACCSYDQHEPFQPTDKDILNSTATYQKNHKRTFQASWYIAFMWLSQKVFLLFLPF